MTLFRPRNLLLLLALLLAIALAAVVMSRYRPAVEVKAVTKTLPSGVDLALQDINYTHSEGGVARWKLVARQVEHRAEEKSTSVSDLRLTFFAADGSEQGTLQARRGQVNPDYSVVEVEGEVRVVTGSGYTLATDHLTFRQQERTIRTDAPVRLSGRGLELNGVGLELNLVTQRLRIPAKVRAVVQAKR